MERANIIDYRCKDKTKKRKHAEVEPAETIVVSNLTDFVFVGGMLNRIDDGTTVTQYYGECTNGSDDDNLSDKGSNCELAV